MSGLNFTAATQAEVALLAATEKAVLHIAVPDANTRIKIKGWSISFDGQDPLAAPIEVYLARASSAGTLANTLTPALRVAGTEASRCTAKSDSSVLPTKGAIMDYIEVHPQSGYEMIYPLGEEIVIPGSGMIALYAKAPAAVNCAARIIYEE